MNKNSEQRRLIYESFKFVYKGKEYFLLTGKTYKLTWLELRILIKSELNLAD